MITANVNTIFTVFITRVLLSNLFIVRVGGNGPAYKTAEEYYDEVLELKKVLIKAIDLNIILLVLIIINPS